MFDQPGTEVSGVPALDLEQDGERAGQGWKRRPRSRNHAESVRRVVDAVDSLTPSVLQRSVRRAVNRGLNVVKVCLSHP